MPWSSLKSQKKQPAGLFNLCRMLIKLRKKEPILQQDSIAGKNVLFYDNESGEPHTLAVRWNKGKTFFLILTNPKGINTKISREIKIRGLPEGKYLGRELLEKGDTAVKAESEDNVISINDCPTRGRGFLIYKFEKI